MDRFYARIVSREREGANRPRSVPVGGSPGAVVATPWIGRDITALVRRSIAYTLLRAMISLKSLVGTCTTGSVSPLCPRSTRPPCMADRLRLSSRQ